MLEERKWRSILLVTACALGLTLGLGLSLLFYYHSKDNLERQIKLFNRFV